MTPEKFTDLIRRHIRLIHKIAHTYCRDATDREDVMQEIILQLWRSRERYDDRFKETTFIYRIAINVAVSFYRRERRHRDEHLSLDAHAITIAGTPDEPNDDLQLLLRCIENLGALDKALVLLYLDGNDHAVIADVLGLSVTNVGTKLSRIKDKLRVIINQQSGAQNGG